MGMADKWWFARAIHELLADFERRVAIVNELETVFVDIGKGVKIAASDIVKGVAELPKVVKVLCVTLKDEPAVRDAIVGLIAQMKPLVADAAVDIAGKGINLPADIQTIKDFQSLIAYFRGTFLPKIESAYHDELDAIEPAVVPGSSTAVPGSSAPAPEPVAIQPAVPLQSEPDPEPEPQQAIAPGHTGAPA